MQRKSVDATENSAVRKYVVGSGAVVKPETDCFLVPPYGNGFEGWGW